jgi:hypothetical protein
LFHRLYQDFGLKMDMKSYQPVPRGCIFGMLSILLGICLTAGTAYYQRSYDPACGGGLSAGFPLAFLCDGSGGSPIGIQGKIDFADWQHVNPPAFLLDFLLYSALLAMAWMVMMGLFRRDLSQDENFRWAVLLCLGYIVAFLFAFVSFQSSRLNFEAPTRHTPTPFIASPTPIGKMPPPQSTPSASP